MADSSGAEVQRTVGGTAVLTSRLRIEHLWVLVSVLVVVWMGFMHPLRLLDFWWHLKVGEVMVSLGEIPREDLFSFTRAGQPFVYQNWLGEVLYYLTYRVGGLALLIGLNTMLLLLAFVPVLHLCLEGSLRVPVGVLCSLVTAIVLGFFGSMRPQVYSFVLFSMFYWILWQYRDGRRDWLWALPLLMVIWVNMHGAFVLGIGLTALVLGAEAIRRVVRGASEDTLSARALGKLGMIVVLMVLATLVNPEGYGVYGYVRQLQVDPASQLFVREWQVPDIKKASDILIFFGPLFLAVMVLFYGGSPPNLTELGLFVMFAVFGLAARRNSVWFGLVISPLLARQLAGRECANLREGKGKLLRLGRLAGGLEGGWRNRSATRRRLNWLILIFLVSLTVMLSPWVAPQLKAGRLRPQLLDSGTPVGAMDYIEAHQLRGNIFHPQMYGDYLIWRLWPQQRAFIDGRVHLYDEAFVKDYVLAFQDAGWESRLAKYDIEYLLLPRDDENSRSIIHDATTSAHWTLLYEDELSVMLRRQP